MDTRAWRKDLRHLGLLQALNAPLVPQRAARQQEATLEAAATQAQTQGQAHGPSKALTAPGTRPVLDVASPLCKACSR